MDDHTDMCTDMNCPSHGRMNRLYASLNQELEAALDECARLQRENKVLREALMYYEPWSSILKMHR